MEDEFHNVTQAIRNFIQADNAYDNAYDPDDMDWDWHGRGFQSRCESAASQLEEALDKYVDARIAKVQQQRDWNEYLHQLMRR